MPHNGGVRAAMGNHWVRAAVLALLLVVAAVLALTLDLPSVPAARRWVDDAGGAAWIGMALGTALVLLGPVPRTAVSILTGVVAGFWTGVVVAFAGALIAALLAFALSRGLGRGTVTRLAGPRLARVDALLEDRGFVAVLLTRLVPVVPFAICSYGSGLVGVRLAPYLLGSALGLVPGTVVQVGIGASVVLVMSGQAAVSLLLPAAGVAVLGWLAVRAWRRRPVPEGSA